MKNNSHVFRYSPHCLLVRRRVTSGFHPPRISPGAARHKNSVDSTSHFVDRIQSSGLSPIACIVLGLGRGRTVDQKGQKPFSQTGTSGVPSGAHCLHRRFPELYFLPELFARIYSLEWGCFGHFGPDWAGC